MIVVNTKETKEPSGLSQLLLGKKGTDDTQFAKFLEAFNLNNSHNSMLENEDFDLETALQKIIIPTDNKENSNPHLIVVDNKKTVTHKVEGSDVNSSKNTKEVLKETTLLHLLQGESTDTEVVENLVTQKVQTEVLVDDESQFLHPKMINTLDPKDIKMVVNAAKEYLKEQIDTIVKEQNIDVKTVPQTLKGLSEMAKKLGVNLEKITLDEIPLPKTQKPLTVAKEPIPLLDMKKQDVSVTIVSLKSTLIGKEKIEAKKEEPLKNALHVSVKDSGMVEEKANAKTVPLQTVKETPKAKMTKTETTKTETPKAKMTKTETTKVETPKTEAFQIPKEAPKKLEVQTAKVSATAIKTEPSEAKLSSAVIDDIEVAKAPKPRAVDSLSELLHGDKQSDTQESSSVKTTPVESKVSQSSFVNVPASDSLEVKAKEAQQMVRHFATDMKEAVENYKPPFTRLKMTLNPAKLGEVDVTLIQRGNNVHINVSSNNTAVTLLSQNVNELKTQLANNGVVNTSMQFSTSHGEHQQQEGRHQQFNGYKDFDQLSDEELEQITSMEITIPQYA